MLKKAGPVNVFQLNCSMIRSKSRSSLKLTFGRLVESTRLLYSPPVNIKMINTGEI